MKKTVIINISGIVFHIDEDAYEKLKAYLDSLNRYFGYSTEGKEILADIESRIAELLQPKLNPGKQSIAIEDIEEILSILGTPEDIAASDSSSYENEENTSISYSGKHYTRRLYRDIDNSVIGGVCSGIGAYLGVDPIIFRIILIALIFAGGVSFIIYPILWIVLPAARTSTQKLEMRGKDINVSNIEKTVKEEINHIQSNMNKPDSVWNRILEVFHEILAFFGVLLKGIGSVLRYVLGTFLILMAVSFSIAVIGALYFKNVSFHGNYNEYFGSVQDFLYGIISPLNADTLIFLAFVIAIIPIAGLIYAGLKLLIRFETSQRWVPLVLSILWILSVISFVVLVFNELDNFKSDATVKEVVTINSSNKILRLSSPATSEKDENTINFFSNSHLFLPLNHENKEEKVGIIRIDIEKTNSTSPEIQIIKEARGEVHSEALESAKSITVKYTQSDSSLVLDPFFRVSNDKRWKFYSAKIIVRIPVGTKIYIDESTRHLLDDVKNTDNYWDEDMINKTWIMTDNGLELVGSSSSEIKPLLDNNKVLNLQLRDRFNINRDDLESYNRKNHYGTMTYNNVKYYYGTIDLEIKKSETNQVLVELVRTSAGSNIMEAQSSIRTMEYDFQQNDSVLWLDPVFRFTDNTWNDQKLKVILRLPINKKVFIHRDLEPLLEDFAAENNRWREDYVNHTWIMDTQGLVNSN